MIKRLEITGIHLDVSSDLKKYIHRKIGGLDRYILKGVRKNILCEVKLEEIKIADKNSRKKCEIILHLPKEKITVSEATINIFAAVDICEEKLKNSLRKYKSMHGEAHLHHRILSKFRLSQ